MTKEFFGRDADETGDRSLLWRSFLLNIQETPY